MAPPGAFPGTSPRPGGPLYGDMTGAASPASPLDDLEVVLDYEGEEPGVPRHDPETGTTEVAMPDGSVIINLTPEIARADSNGHDENIAGLLSESERMRIGGHLLEGIGRDDESRKDWLNTRAAGLDLLGLKVEQAKASSGTGSAPLEGMSTVRHPLLQEAVLRFQSNSYAELCPAAGPAKCVNASAQTIENDQLAGALERDLNYYLTTIATEYYPDTDRMLWWLGYGGSMFKKVYNCPLRRRPVSEVVDAKDLIVADAVTDLANAPRVTHEISMRRSVMKRMQILGVYLRTPLTETPVDPDPVDRKVAEIQGVKPDGALAPEEADYSLYECYCELDIPGFEHIDEEGNVTGLALPYRVTLEKTSGRILEIRRNWEEGNEDLTPDIPFVHYPYVRGMGFYCLGLLHILGNTTKAITNAWRLMLDAGQFANFPGFLFAQSANRQVSNEFRVAPGSGAPINTNGMPIQDVIMPLPYKEAGPSLMALTENISKTGERVGGTADTPVGEGVQNAPVGTTLALIDQATRIESAVHKRLHQAQSEELQKLVKLFRGDPEALWRGNKRCELGRDKEKTLKALENCEITPYADPNVPSRMHRLAKVAAIKQLQAQAPQLYDAKAVDTLCLNEIGVSDPESLFAQAQAPPPPDPIMLAQLELKKRDLDIKEAKVTLDEDGKVKDRELKENMAIMEMAERIATHPASLGYVETAVETVPKIIKDAQGGGGAKSAEPQQPKPKARPMRDIPFGPPPPSDDMGRPKASGGGIMTLGNEPIVPRYPLYSRHLH